MAYHGNKVIKRDILTGEIVMIYPTVAVAAVTEGVSKETIRQWCHGKPQRYESRYTYEYKGKEPKKEPSKGVRGWELSLCWKCDNAYGGCSWSKEFKPVPGWTATRKDQTAASGSKEKKRRIESYLVHECPEFVPDPPLKERIRRLREGR